MSEKQASSGQLLVSGYSEKKSSNPITYFSYHTTHKYKEIINLELEVSNFYKDCFADA